MLIIQNIERNILYKLFSHFTPTMHTIHGTLPTENKHNPQCKQCNTIHHTMQLLCKGWTNTSWDGLNEVFIKFVTEQTRRIIHINTVGTFVLVVASL